MLFPRRERPWLVTALALSAAVLGGAIAGCFDPGVDLDATPALGSSSGTGTAPVFGTGLPCDLSHMLNDSCGSCHARPPRGGALTTLLNRDDMLRISPSEQTLTLAEHSLLRMRETQAPMPPSGSLPPDQATPLESWIGDGMPAVSCEDALVVPPSPYDTPVICSSMQHWPEVGDTDEEMYPGQACNACHMGAGGGRTGLPIYSVGGTVYPTAHEPNNCYGVSEGIQVVVEDARGVQLALEPNEAGNFFTEEPLVAPYRVKVIRGADVRAMSQLAEHGDCNFCHLQDGWESAPGRVMAP